MRFAPRAALLLLITSALFAPTIGYGTVYEDGRDAQLTLDPGRYGVRELAAMPLRSMTKLSLAADLALFGIQPWGFHLGSVLWHVFNVLIFFALAWLVLPPWGAVAAAGVFAWHPLQVEAVAYVSARADLVSTCGLLLALLAASLRSVTGALVGVSVACLGKESAIVAWGLVPLWAAWTRAAFPVGRWLLMGLVAAGALLPWFWPYVQMITLDSVLAGSQLAAIGRLLALLVVPVGFTVDHDWASIAWLGPLALIAAAGVTTWAVVAGWPARSWLAFAWLWTLVALLPRFVVPLDEGLHEHHTYNIVVMWALAFGALASGLNRRGKGLCQWPLASKETLVERVGVQAKFSRPFSDGHGPAIRPDHVPIGARIISLLSLRGPTAISRFVVAIVVDPINGVRRRWTRPHVLKKRDEVVTPPLTDGDASAAIAMPGWNRLIRASLNHGRPHSVFRAVAALVFGGVGLQPFKVVTPARHYAAAHHIASLLRGVFTAVARAQHSAIMVVSLGGVSEHAQAAKSLSRDVDLFRHPWIISCSCI